MIVWRSLLTTLLCDKVCQRLAAGPGTPVSFTNKTNRHNIAGMLLKVALNIINQPTRECGSYHAFPAHK